MAKIIVIDEDECQGCETCCELCPDVFGFDSDSEKATVLNPNATDECVQEAMDACPTECINWEEE